MGGDEVGEAAVGGVDFPGEDYAWDWGLGRVVGGDWKGWWGHEEFVGEHAFGEVWSLWLRHEELVAERGFGAVWWCCGAGAVGEHASCGGEGCGGGGRYLE